MPLDGRQTRQFADVIYKVYNIVEFDGVLLSINRPTVDMLAPLRANFKDAVLEIVLAANREGWVPGLLRAIAEDRPNQENVQQFFAANSHLDPAHNPLLVNPWQTYRLFGGQLFLGRALVRKFLSRMSNSWGRKILIITSPHRKIGKKHTRTFITYVADQAASDRIATATLNSVADDLRSLATKIAIDWGLNPDDLPRQSQEQENRWAEQLASFFLANNDGVTRWLIIDVFDPRSLSVGVGAFIEAIGKGIQSTATFRMVLINYTDPPPFSFLYLKEIVLPITLQEIEEALVSIHKATYNTIPEPHQISEYMAAYEELLVAYKQKNPDLAETSIPVHYAAADVTELM